MTRAFRLRSALKRGALVTFANWPLVIAQFVANAVYKLAMGVPIVGGVLMVAVLVGEDTGAMLSEGVRAAAGLVVAALVDAPVALGSFMAALGLMAVGAAVITCLVRAGTMPLLVTGEQAIDNADDLQLRLSTIRRAGSWNLTAFLDAMRHFRRRYLWLGAGLVVAYVVIGGLYGAVIAGTYGLSDRGGWSSAWPLVAVLATSGGAVAITLVNLAHDLLQIIIASADCGLREALGRLWDFLVHDARQVAGIFGVVLALVLVATAVSTLITGGLGLVAFVPLVGLVAIPLLAADWLVRGLVFEYVGLTALTAYLSQYRRFAEMPRGVPAAPSV
jgi:hypothetical protein